MRPTVPLEFGVPCEDSDPMDALLFLLRVDFEGPSRTLLSLGSDNIRAFSNCDALWQSLMRCCARSSFQGMYGQSGNVRFVCLGLSLDLQWDPDLGPDLGSW